MALTSSSHRARGLPLFHAPPPIPNIIDFSKLFSLRMMCPKYDSCCFFINASSGLVALISSITDLLVLLAVHGRYLFLAVFSSTVPQLEAVNSSSLCFSYRPGFTTIQPVLNLLGKQCIYYSALCCNCYIFVFPYLV